MSDLPNERYLLNVLCRSHGFLGGGMVQLRLDGTIRLVGRLCDTDNPQLSDAPVPMSLDFSRELFKVGILGSEITITIEPKNMQHYTLMVDSQPIETGTITLTLNDFHASLVIIDHNANRRAPGAQPSYIRLVQGVVC